MAKFKAYSTEQGELFPTYLSDWISDDHLVRLVSDISISWIYRIFLICIPIVEKRLTIQRCC